MNCKQKQHLTSEFIKVCVTKGHIVFFFS